MLLIGDNNGAPVPQIAQKIIDTIRGGSPLFAYYPEKSWLSSSAFVHSVGGGSGLTSNSR